MTLSIPFIDETKEHVELINACARIYGRPELTEFDLAVYIRAIGADNVQEVIKNLQLWLHDATRFPTPAEIRRRIYNEKSYHASDEEKNVMKLRSWRAALA